MHVFMVAGHTLNAKRPQLPLLLASSSNNKHNIDNDQRAEQWRRPHCQNHCHGLCVAIAELTLHWPWSGAVEQAWLSTLEQLWRAHGKIANRAVVIVVVVAAVVDVACKEYQKAEKEKIIIRRNVYHDWRRGSSINIANTYRSWTHSHTAHTDTHTLTHTNRAINFS